MVELPLTYADLFVQVGARDAGGGIILVGPPGGGQTLLARAMAGDGPLTESVSLLNLALGLAGEHGAPFSHPFPESGDFRGINRVIGKRHQQSHGRVASASQQ